MKTTIFSFIPGLIIILLCVHANAQDYDTIETTIPGVLWGDYAWGDYDNDNDLDLFVTGHNREFYEEFTFLYSNEGNGLFTKQTSIEFDSLENSVASWGDFDNDGLLDIIIAGQNPASEAVTSVYRNYGDNTFYRADGVDIQGIHSGKAEWVDFNNDGKDDILVFGYNGLLGHTDDAVFKIYANLGPDGFGYVGFAEMPTGIIPPADGDIAWFDYDNDNDYDLIASGEEFNGFPSSKLYENMGNFIFEEKSEVDIPDFHDTQILCHDYNFDGYPDFVLSGNDGFGYSLTVFYKNNRNGTFSADITLGDKLHISRDDVDSDGETEIVLYDPYDDFIQVLNYTSEVEYSIDTITDGFIYNSVYSKKSDPADFDNDGDLDFLLSNSTTMDPVNAELIENLSTEINSPPAVPANLVSDINSERIVLSWDASSDSETPTYQVSYNLVISSTKEGEDIVSPSSNLLTGQRKMPEAGNAGCGTSFTLTGLDPGTYYWRVQSVDNAFLASPFSVQDSFIVLPGFSYKEIFEDEGLSGGNAILGDYDNDGDFDLLYNGWYQVEAVPNPDPENPPPDGPPPDGSGNFIIITDTASVLYKNNGDGTFAEPVYDFIKEISPRSAEWLDYDNDNLIDLLIYHELNDEILITIFRNTGMGSLAEAATIETNVLDGDAFWADVNNDGRSDFAVFGNEGSPPDDTPIVRIFQSNKDFTFSEVTFSGIAAIYTRYAAWADVDNDYDLDLIVTGTDTLGDDCTHLYKNLGNFDFEKIPDLPFENLKGEFVFWKDFNNDGYFDILLSNVYLTANTGYSNIYANNTGENFTLLNSKTGKSYTPGDFNSDGNLDLPFSVSVSGAKTYLYIGNESANFTEEIIADKKSYVPVIGDIDNDNDLDYISRGLRSLYYNFVFQQYFLSIDPSFILTNNSYINNDPPSAPSGLNAVQTDTGVEFSWDAANDDHTHASALTYNLRVGTVSHGNDILSSESNAVTGKMLIPRQGNCGLNTGWKLDSLPDDTYYWSVQAVDESLIAGEWSEEHQFKVSILKANFNADTVCVGSTTTFADNSVSATETINSWTWRFPDGSSATERNPDYVFNEAGSHEVRLVITSDNYTDTITKTVVVKAKPEAAFTVETVCHGISSEFINTSNENGLQISSWKWDFGDDSGSEEKDPGSHLYFAPSSYPVKLVAIAENGCSDSISQIAAVGENPVSFISAGGVTEICRGDSVVLTGNYNANFRHNWNLNQTPLTQADSSSHAAKLEGSYTMTVTNPVGNCSATSDPIEVDVLNAPDAPTIVVSGNTEICSGDSVLLEVTDNPDYGYQWKSGTGTVGENVSHYTVKSTGVYSVEVYNKTTACSTTSVNSFDVNVHAAPEKPDLNITGDFAVCGGEDQYLSIVNYYPGDDYFWYRDGALIDNQSDSLLLEESGIYVVVVQNAFECLNTSLSTNATVFDELSKPVIRISEGSELVCPDELVVLTVEDPIESLQYQWQKNGVLILDETGDTFMPESEGFYSVKVSAQGCENESDPLEISHKDALPKPEISAIGSQVWYLSVSNDSAANYRWYFEGELVQEGDEYLYVAHQNMGKYYAELTDNYECYTRTDVISIPENTIVNIGQINPWEHLKIYPNPTPGIFTLEMDNSILGELIIDIYGSAGQRVINIKFEKANSFFRAQIDLSDQPAAVYLIGLMLDEYQTTRRLVVE